MRNVVLCLAALVLLSTAACSSKDAGTAPSARAEASAAPAAKVLAKGDVAPPFRLVGSDGKEHALADHLGKEAVVVAWFPKAFTGG